MKAISVEVYRSTTLGDCSNGGISSKFNTLYLACEDGFLDIPEDHPQLVQFEKGPRDTVHMVPYIPCPKDLCGYMAGGCFVYSSDARFTQQMKRVTGIEFYGAVALHDRCETWEQYEALSR